MVSRPRLARTSSDMALIRAILPQSQSLHAAIHRHEGCHGSNVHHKTTGVGGATTEKNLVISWGPVDPGGFCLPAET